jgi:hypothetical protein
MFKKTFILIAALLLFTPCVAQAFLIGSNWVGTEGIWGNANNWDPNIVPDNDEFNIFIVTIDANESEVEVGLQQSRTIGTLDCYGDVGIEKWTPNWVELTINNGLTNYGVLDIENLEICGNVTNTTGAEMNLIDVEIEGILLNSIGAEMEVEGEVKVGAEDDGNGGSAGLYVENAGSVIVYASSDFWGDFYFNNTGQVNIYGGQCGSDEVFDNNSTGVIKGFGVLYADQLLRNKGTIYAYGGSLAVSVEGPLLNSGTLGNNALSALHIKPAVDVNNFGTIEVRAGGGVAFDCNLVNEPNAVIELLGGTLAATTITQSADANFAGFGGITGDVVIAPNGLIELTGPTNIIGDVTIGAGATLEVSDGTTLITGHTTNNGTIRMIGGRVICQGGLTNNGNVEWLAGDFSNAADFNLDGTVDMRDFAEFADVWLWQASW